MSPRETAIGTLRSTGWKFALLGRASATLAIALGLFAIAAIALAVNLTLQRDSFGWVEHTNEVLRTVSALERRILEAESGERGYLLTGESNYLDSYNRSQGDVPKLLEELRQLISDNPNRVQLLDEFRPIVEARLAEFKQVVELGPAHSNDALEILRTARSRQLTALIEERLGQFRQAELNLLGERQQRASREAIVATLIAAVMAVLAMLSAAMGAFLLRKQRSASQLRIANEELAISHSHLQSILETVPDAMVVIDEMGQSNHLAQLRSASSGSPSMRFKDGTSAC
jgi:two-component system sensor kinase FixL